MTKRYLLLLISLAVGFSSTALAQKIGPEFQVNTYTTHDQGDPSVASDATGNFVVVWSSYAQDGSSTGVFGQRYDSGGNPLGGEFQVNTYITSGQSNPSVASDTNGAFVVVWGGSSGDGDRGGIFGQRYDSAGNPLGGEFQVNTSTTGGQGSPSVASNPAGNFVVVWDSSLLGIDVFGQRYDSGGTRLGGEFQVNTYVPGDASDPSVATDATGNFVVVWEDYRMDDGLDGPDIFGQRYDSDGNPLGGEFQVNTYTTSSQGDPVVASDAAGNFLVAWESLDQDGNSFGVFGQRYARSGDQIGSEFPVNTYTVKCQANPAAASDAGGNVIVVWQSAQSVCAGPRGEVFGQRYDSRGNRVGGEFQVNTHTESRQLYPSVTSDTAGNFVVVWQSGPGYPDPDGDGRGIFGQRFSAACEASVQVREGVHTPGSSLAAKIHIAHHRPRTVTVPWELRLFDADGRRIVRHTTEPHTFEPGDVMDRDVELRLPTDLAAGTYTLELAIRGMAGTGGATTTLRVIRAE